jgi:hypothetical protein
VHPPLRRSQTYKRFQQIGGGRGTLNEFARTGPHGVDDDLWLAQIADGKDGGVGHLLVEKFNGAQGLRRIVRWNVNQGNVGTGSSHPARHRIGPRHREGGASVYRACHSGAVDENLQHRALLVVSGDDDD